MNKVQRKTFVLAGIPIAVACLLFAGLGASASIIQVSYAPRQPHVSGGADGAGILPFVGLTTPTPGQVIDAQRNAIAGAIVIVTHPQFGILAQATTNTYGQFAVNLPAITKLEIALPEEGVAGIGISAGVPILIVVP